jgi:hypothetical protein
MTNKEAMTTAKKIVKIYNKCYMHEATELAELGKRLADWLLEFAENEDSVKSFLNYIVRS